MNNIGKNIRSARKKANLSQENLARLCDVSTTAVRHWEKGRHKPSSEHLKIIASNCDVPVDLLLYSMDDEDINEIVNTSHDILKNFSPNTWQCVSSVSIKDHNKYQAIVSSVFMCGYKWDDIINPDDFIEFMEPPMESIKNSIELYMKTINPTKRKDERT